MLLGFEDAVIGRPEDDDPPDDSASRSASRGRSRRCRTVPTCSCSPPSSPAIGGPDLPLEVSAIDSIPAATDAPERSLRIVAHQQVSLLRIRDGDAVSCDLLERCLAVSRYLLEGAPDWLG